MSRWHAEVRLAAALLFCVAVAPSAGAATASDAVARVTARDATPETSSYEDFFRLLPADQGANRGYDGSGAPESGLLAARVAIHDALSDLLLPAGGTVTYQDFDARGFAGRNIVGVLPGDGPGAARRCYLVAHYDSQENPGADDNASGVAGVLAAARALAPFSFDATIVFIALDQEEGHANGWAQGSRVAAAAARAAREEVSGVVALDMIAYNHRGRNRAHVCRADARRTGGAKALSDRLLAAFAAHTVLEVSPLTKVRDSDHYRFHQKRFPAALLIEEMDEYGWPTNRYWHEPTDFFLDLLGFPQRQGGDDYIDFDYAAEMTKGAVGWAAAEAGLRPVMPADR